MIFLNVVTFIGIYFPVTVKKNLQEEDIKNIIDKKTKDDKRNKEIEDRATFF